MSFIARLGLTCGLFAFVGFMMTCPLFDDWITKLGKYVLIVSGVLGVLVALGAIWLT